jgi:hypothetical protein
MAAGPKIILAARDRVRREAFLSALESSAQCTVTETLREIPSLLRQQPYKGILIDVFLNVKANFMEKLKIADSLDAMPCATLNFDAVRRQVRLLMLNNNHGTARNLKEFISLCDTFQPQIIYPQNQDGLYLNAVLSTEPHKGGNAERTFAMSISAGGCFLFTANHEAYRPQDTVWVDFVGLENRSPIMGKICWKCDWGVSHAVPGIYVSFESMQEDQYEEIRNLMLKGRR